MSFLANVISPTRRRYSNTVNIMSWLLGNFLYWTNKYILVLVVLHYLYDYMTPYHLPRCPWLSQKLLLCSVDDDHKWKSYPEYKEILNNNFFVGPIPTLNFHSEFYNTNTDQHLFPPCLLLYPIIIAFPDWFLSMLTASLSSIHHQKQGIYVGRSTGAARQLRPFVHASYGMT